MKLTYDRHKDILNIRFNEFPIVRSTASDDGMIFDYDDNNRLVAIEMPSASAIIDNPLHLEIGEFKDQFVLVDKLSVL